MLYYLTNKGDVMKKIILFIICLVIFPIVSKASYYSITNKPVFYGASEITIEKGAIQSFDVKDTRFRIFAKDFEDGDITNNITYTGIVDVNTPGIYTITYTVCDSHGNISTLNVPVTIKNTEGNKINVVRTIYTIPSVWNLDMVNVKKNNYGDRQILGIYLSSADSIKVRSIDLDRDIRVDFINNNSKNESNTTISKDGTWKEIKNTKSYSSVPIITSPVLSKEENSVDKVFHIEIEYTSSISKLDYYHYKDDENEFRSNWIKSNNDYSFIENEVINLVVPLSDINKLTNYYKKCFTSLDNFLEYYQKVVDKMDEMIGLSLNPENPTDQNVRTRYFIRANKSGVGAAYYAGNHVGINNSSIAPIFEMNWGGLHELAHGYQGDFGKGAMGLGEVGNNILGYYIQNNKNIYTYNDSWLGNISDIEKGKNSERLSKVNFNDIQVSTKLYMIVNLLNYFEKEETYAKMFKYYRNLVNNGIILNNQDVYVKSIADLYHVNIIPYMESWHLTISDEIRSYVYEKEYPLVSIKADIDNSNNYNVVVNSDFSTIKGNIKLNININNIEDIINEKLYLMDSNNVIKEVIIDSNNISINDINIGTYLLKMPVNYKYTQDYMYITVKEGNNTYTYNYNDRVLKDYNNYMTLYIKGYFKTNGLIVSFTDNYNKMNVSFSGSMFNKTASFKVYDENNNIVCEETVTDGYFGKDKTGYSVDLFDNYIIEIDYSSPDRIEFISNITKSKVEEYSTNSKITKYKVIDNTLVKLDDMNVDDAKNINYTILKNKLKEEIDSYLNNTNEEELNNYSDNFLIKSYVIDAYNLLNEIDKNEYKTIINKMTTKPTYVIDDEDDKEQEEDKEDIAKEETEVKEDISKEEDKEDIVKEETEVKEEEVSKEETKVKEEEVSKETTVIVEENEINDNKETTVIVKENSKQDNEIDTVIKEENNEIDTVIKEENNEEVNNNKLFILSLSFILVIIIGYIRFKRK